MHSHRASALCSHPALHRARGRPRVKDVMHLRSAEGMDSWQRRDKSPLMLSGLGQGASPGWARPYTL